MTLPPDWPATFKIPSGKIIGYLLNPDHPRGGPKSRFFVARGFDPSRPEQLAAALLATATRVNLTKREPTGHGLKLTFEGPIETPADPGTARVRTVWLVGPGTSTAAFVTAVPR